MRRIAVLAGLGLAGLAVVWAVEPNLIVGLRSPRALAWAAAVGAGCLAVGLVARRIGAAPWVAVAAGALPGLVAGGLVVVRPILMPRSLNEALPSVAATTPPATTPPAATPSARRTGTPPPSRVTATATRPGAATSSPAATTPPPAPTTPPPAAGPVRVATGPLRGLAGHSAEGRVSTYRLADGSHVVRFEDVDIGGTPDPEVYVLPGRDRTGKRGGTHLGALKAEKGSFHYVLPPAFAGTEFTVLVWCEQFAVDIAHATQA